MQYQNPKHALTLGSTLGLALAGSAAAATITVDDDLQDLPSAQFTSLSAAMAVAQAGDEIQVYPGVYRETLECSKSITIVGIDGPNQTIIDGEGVRGCAILGEASFLQPSSPIILEGFTLMNGMTFRGGGVQVYDWVRLENCRIMDCTATLHGGGIHAGGYYPDLLFELHNVEVSGCTAPNGNGGGISIEGLGPDSEGYWAHTLTRMVVTGGLQLSDNHARKGGGLSLVCATFDEIANERGMVRIQGNSATYQGGGVHASLSAFLSSKNTRKEFTGNWSESRSGGGMYFDAQQSVYPSASGTPILALHDASFTDNTAFEDGGGLCVRDSNARVVGARFHGNTAAQGVGGGIGAFLSNLSVRNSRFIGNLAPSNSAATPSAAAIDAVLGSLLVHRGWFQDHDNAMQISDCSTGIRGSMFMDNTLALRNWGIQSDLLIQNTYFVSNGTVLSGPGTDLGGNVIVP